MDFIIEKFLMVVDTGVAAFLSGGVALAVLLMAAAALWVSILGRILLFTGAAFGPLLLAMAPWSVTRDLAIGWGKFMLGASMYQAVGVVVLLMMEGIFNSVAVLAGESQVNAPGMLPDAAVALGALAVSVVGVAAMLQVPGITASLFGGGGSNSLRMPGMPKPKGKPDQSNDSKK